MRALDPAAAAHRRLAVSALAPMLAASLIARAAFGAATPAASITPDPRIQTAIEQVAASKSETELAERMDALVELSGPNFRDLIPQLVAYTFQQRDTKAAMVPAVLRERLGITNAQLVEGLLPYLDTPDTKQRGQLYRWLAAVDGLTGEPRDFGVYQTIIIAQRHEPPLGLVRYMYVTDPTTAAVVMADVYATPEQRPALAALRRPVDQARTADRAARTLDAEQIAAARAALETLSKSPEWWMRLYAASMLTQVPELGTPQIVERLRGDSNVLVRETVG